MKNLIIICLSVLYFISAGCNSGKNGNSNSADDSANVYIAVSEDFNLQIDTLTIYGTLALPEKEAPYDVVLIIAGSGPTDRNGNNKMGLSTDAYKMLADTLAYHGFASVRFDKRGIAKSYFKGFSEADLLFDTYVNDAVEWIKKIETDKRFAKIIVLGHSEGSLIGILATNLTGTNAFISVAGPAESADSLIHLQIANQSEELGREVSGYLNTLKNGKQVVVSNTDLWNLFRPSIQPYLISWFKYTPKIEFAKLNIPTLVIQGTTDIQVDFHEAEVLAAANPKSQLKIIEGMNHILKIADADTLKNSLTYTNPNLPLSEEFCLELIKFLKGL
jgi:pimeloyl-ACP methyl ester carboxylesterase